MTVERATVRLLAKRPNKPMKLTIGCGARAYRHGVRRGGKMTKLFNFSIIILLLVNVSGYASSPEAWAEHDLKVREMCIKASGFREAKAEGDIMLFPDEVGYSALFIRGRYPQLHMKNREGLVLCVFNRSTDKAYVTEAPNYQKVKR